jgi:fatty acid desaturase
VTLCEDHGCMGRGGESGGDEMAAGLDPRRLWIIHGKRYDLTKNGFIDRHPGGRVALDIARGRDCTELFESYHALFDSPALLMDKYLAEDQSDVPQPVFDWTSTPVYDDLKKRVRAYFGEKGLRAGKHKCDDAAWARYFLWTALTVVSALAWLQGEWWSIIALPWFYWLGPSAMMHSGSHWALSKSELVNRAGAYSGSYHISVLHWYHQHVIGHHSHTNMHERDPDLTHFQHLDRDGPGYRLHEAQPWLEKYTDWRAAMPMQAWFTTLGPSLINQFKYMMEGTFMGVPVLMSGRPLSSTRVAQHVVGRLIVFGTAMVLPFWLFSPIKAAFFALFPLGFHGSIYYAYSQISHCNEHSNDEQEKKGQEWATHQIMSCVDYNTDSLLWRTLSIGLNAQAFHHLFPSVEPCHYGPLSKILAHTCKEHGVRYTTYPSFAAAVQAHVKYVGSLNERQLQPAPAPSRLAAKMQ